MNLLQVSSIIKKEIFRNILPIHIINASDDIQKKN